MPASHPPLDLDALRRVAAVVARGGVVAFPTETVYGIGASVRQPAAIARIFEIKSRPATRPLMIHVRDRLALHAFGRDVPQWAARAADAIWPGPLTVVVPAASTVPRVALGGLDSVGLRAPDHPLTAALLDALAELEGGVPGLVGTSANLHAAAPATTIAHVRDELGDRIDDGLDGGPCTLGIESTVVADEGGPLILRPGAVTAERLHAITGLEPRHATPTGGAGTTTTRLFDRGEPLEQLAPGDVVLGTRRPAVLPDAVRWIDVPPELDARARELFERLRTVDDAARVWIERAPPEGIGVAINARLERWAADRAASKR